MKWHVHCRSLSKSALHIITTIYEHNSVLRVLEKLIQDCDTALANLQKTINSEKTNPEEIFYARTAFIKITEQRKDLIKRLEEAKKTQKSTINFFDASNER